MNAECCHWIKTQGPKKVIIKFPGRKDDNKVRIEKKNLKEKNLTSLRINKPIYINDSLRNIRNSGRSVNNYAVIKESMHSGYQKDQSS